MDYIKSKAKYIFMSQDDLKTKLQSFFSQLTAEGTTPVVIDSSLLRVLEEVCVADVKAEVSKLKTWREVSN